MKKTFFICLLWLCSVSVLALPYYVRVNGSSNYLASPTGETDFQGRTQYAAMCVPLQVGDVVTCYDAEYGSEWTIATLDPYGAYASFSAAADGIHCSQKGQYDIYLKMAFEDDVVYIGEAAADCQVATEDDPSRPDEVYTTSAPAQYSGVMLQAFYWDSYSSHGYGDTKWATLLTEATELGQWFDLIWLPPSSWAGEYGGTGYLPICYNLQSSAWGTKADLRSLIQTLHANGSRVVADIVVNHINTEKGWCTLHEQNFGSLGQFDPNMSWICANDEAFGGGHCSSTPGGADDGYGSEANYEAGRDWDHSNPQVRAMIKAYLNWLRSDLKYDGWRYDYCKGFHNSHINEYNAASQAFFSVMEMWDGNPDVLLSHLNDAGYNTLTFDFGTKYEALNNGIAMGNYAGCKGSGLLGRGKGRYAVTFIDSHDSFQRDGNEFCGAGNSMKNADKVLQANAYILSMPGVPCVFYPHWVTFKKPLQDLINARYKAGVHSESAVADEAGSGYYRATITGTNGTLRLFLGPNSGYGTTPAGYTLAAKGNDWAVYYQLNSAIGNKTDNRTPIATDVPSTSIVSPSNVVEKKIVDGHIYIIRDGVHFNTLGQRVAK